MPYVVGSLGSRPAASKGLGRARTSGVAGAREPRGTRHAVDSETGTVACGTRDTLRVFPGLSWAPEGEWCASCESVVPFTVT
ncbi:MAG TPA: hypothetical protein VGA11_00300 [Acidimicrobiia bacterium]